jgi:hypothetical protein
VIEADGVEIRLTRHARMRMEEYVVDEAMIRRCLEDPDAVERIAVRPARGRRPPAARRYLREFPEGLLVLAVDVRGGAYVIATVFWWTSDLPPKHRRRARR